MCGLFDVGVMLGLWEWVWYGVVVRGTNRNKCPGWIISSCQLAYVPRAVWAMNHTCRVWDVPSGT